MFDAPPAPTNLPPGAEFTAGPNKATYVVQPDGKIALKGSPEDKTPPPFDDMVSLHKNDKLVINGVEVIFLTAVRIRVPYGYKRVVKAPGPDGALVDTWDNLKTGIDNPDGSNFTIAKFDIPK
jgi:hypothetical protein